ncbi:MAG TPA: alpha-amylase family glycosyl hydrolase [Acidobacteriaceae bacterium]|nr:alpha-amylase family glycosyl hydrolase [Acidobacteriaceae bacterium]
MMEFHVSRKARQTYEFNRALFAFSGNVIFANLSASREFARRMNQVRGAERDPARTVQPGALYAMGMIDELSHALVAYYRKQLDPSSLDDALAWFEAQLGQPTVEKTLLAFVEHFPPVAVYRGEQEPAAWLQGSTDGLAHRTMAFEEMMLLWLANANPAFKPFSELFDDQDLGASTDYPNIISGLRGFFATRPAIGPDNLNLIDMLRAPALASPDSLSGQLAFIKTRWAAVLGAEIDRILIAIDILKEEDIAIWMLFHPPSAEEIARRRRGGQFGGVSEAPSLSEGAQEYERFSPDQDWMPTTVLLAKSTYVWLEQLSRKYGWHIHRLDQIPNEELALMAQRGLNSLWLIGIWERSRASQTIKQLCGNPDAVASAYSLYDYSISADLGGEAAYRDLRDRAYAHGIRLASDMVPNHMGIDSNWVIEHPEWFLSREDSPYPAYRFEGPDLSHDGRVEIKIEDHYYEQTDAAVVFRRRDKWTGDTRYVYHGNDGTSFPWNDTAQLDYLNPAAREQVIQTILHVARLFPIIRFDAAMTLAKRHFERLWYPMPGTGGAIPSRAEYAISQAEFNRRMPEEFWREVVDRVAREVPGTLLLAEAFWLMEAYFVRTLGMHRVYNSAFMNMMRDEENAKYRTILKDTLQFDPDILKRYVNFMSNPDERTAIDQFGTGDKCFGVATLMATLPGLPMFGHGQIEGFTEKYGMEFRKPRYDERPDRWLVERHDREIAPLLHRRWLFAESHNFRMYDFHRPDGSVDENVFAYSNRRGDHKALVIYHNRYATTYGTLHHSAGYADKGAGQLRQQSIAEAFSLPGDHHTILAFRDSATGLDHLHRASRIASSGFSIELQAYKYHVFVDWRELRPDDNHRWDLLCDSLQGRGVADLEEARVSLELAPVQDALVAVLNPEIVHLAAGIASAGIPVPGCREPISSAVGDTFLRNLEKHSSRFFSEAGWAYAKRVSSAQREPIDDAELWQELCNLVRASVQLPLLEPEFAHGWPADARVLIPSASPGVAAEQVWGPVIAHCVLTIFGRAMNPQHPAQAALEAFDRLRLRDALARSFDQLGIHGEDSWRAAARIRSGFLAETLAAGQDRVAGYPRQFWDDPDVRWLIDVHRAPVHLPGASNSTGAGHHEEAQPVGEQYFNKELHEQLLWWLQLPALLRMAQKPVKDTGAEPGETAAAAKASPAASAKTKRQPGREPAQVSPPKFSSRRAEILDVEVRKALDEAERAGYRPGMLLDPPPEPLNGKSRSRRRAKKPSME